jgi:hypothetical protein
MTGGGALLGPREKLWNRNEMRHVIQINRLKATTNYEKLISEVMSIGEVAFDLTTALPLADCKDAFSDTLLVQVGAELLQFIKNPLNCSKS